MKTVNKPKITHGPGPKGGVPQTPKGPGPAAMRTKGVHPSVSAVDKKSTSKAR